MKKAYVYIHKSGWWVAEAKDTHELIGDFYDTELEAYKAANRAGYIVE